MQHDTCDSAVVTSTCGSGSGEQDCPLSVPLYFDPVECFTQLRIMFLDRRHWFTEITMNNGVEMRGKTGEIHPGFRTVNEDAGHIVLHVEHVEHDMGERTTTTSANEEIGREGTDSTESKKEEQAESVIETDCFGEELLQHCVRADEEAGSIVLHVGHDMNENEKNDEEAEDVEIRRTHRGDKNHTQRRETASERGEQAKKKCIRDKKNTEKAGRVSTTTRRLERD